MKILKRIGIIALVLFLSKSTIVEAKVSYEKELEIRKGLNNLKLLIDTTYYTRVDTDAMLNEVLDEIKEDTTFDNAAKLFVSKLKDPYSEYYTLAELNAFNDLMKAEYYGIGVEVAEDETTGGIKINRVFDKSPAKKAKLKKGDIILKIDKKDIRGLKLTDATKLIKCKKGTHVLLLILRNKKRKNIISERNEVTVPTVYSKVFKNNLAYIRVSGFLENTDEEFEKELDKLDKKNVEGIVIDLRDNGGGFVDTAYNMLNRILPSGERVLSFRYNDGHEEIFITRNEENKEDKVVDLPIVILINKNSASASELFTGALVDKGLAVTVGERSFGKGVAQTLYSVSDAGKMVGGVKLTTINYYLPKGESINKIGIKPDYKVKYKIKNKKDLQLEKALKLLET